MSGLVGEVLAADGIGRIGHRGDDGIDAWTPDGAERRGNRRPPGERLVDVDEVAWRVRPCAAWRVRSLSGERLQPEPERRPDGRAAPRARDRSNTHASSRR